VFHWAWFSACLPKCNWKIVSCTINSFCVGLRNIWAWLNYEVRKPARGRQGNRGSPGDLSQWHTDRPEQKTAVSHLGGLGLEGLGLLFAYANHAAEDMHYAFVNNRSSNCCLCLGEAHNSSLDLRFTVRRIEKSALRENVYHHTNVSSIFFLSK